MSRPDDADRPALQRALDAIETVGQARVLITGGTGFVGTSVLKLLDECAEVGRRWEVTSVSRRPPSNELRACLPALRPEFVECDMADGLDAFGAFDLVLHAATPTDARTHIERPLDVVDSIVAGTRNVISWAQRQGNRPLVVHTSSGAVYGEQPPDLSLVPEDSRLGPPSLDATSGYAESKRVAETMLAIAHDREILRAVNTRLFAFVGPSQPRDGHFAITSFLRDAKAGGPIVVRGSGQVVRSYLYEEDMAAWLIAALAQGGAGPVPDSFHVGSSRAWSLRGVAEAVGRLTGCEVDVLGDERQDGPRGRYVPDTTRTRAALGVAEWTSLDDAVLRTLAQFASPSY